MEEIKCPNCGKVFQLDEEYYSSIIKQVRDHEFEEELKNREKALKKEKEDALAILENKLKLESTLQMVEKEKKIKEKQLDCNLNLR